MSGLEDADAAERKNYKKPHSARNPIPTVQQYRDFKHQQRQELGYEDSKGAPIQSDGQAEQASWSETAQSWFHRGEEQEPKEADTQDLTEHSETEEDAQSSKQQGEGSGGKDVAQDTSQTAAAQTTSDPKQKRKQMKHSDPSRAEREVTDPVTHLPITIHDYTGDDLKNTAENSRDDDNDGVDDAEDKDIDLPDAKDRGRTQSGLEKADQAQKREHGELYDRFPPPRYDEARNELARVQKKAAVFVLISTASFVVLVLAVELLVPDRILTFDHKINPRYILAGETVFTLVFIALGIGAVQNWAQMQAKSIWDDAVWSAQKNAARKQLKKGQEETTLWLSKLIGSIWPLVNPDLFTSVADTLEDVMQASLPRMVRMVSVEDIGQGSEPIRILGVKWLPKGAAGRAIDEQGGLGQDQKDKAQEDAHKQKSQSNQDRQADPNNDKDDQAESGDPNQGMGAEEGEFVNVELAFAYRASRFQKRVKDRQKNAHLLLAFYLPGNIKLPVWVELRGIVGSCRARLQLTPDPPFVALCTLTFLGQPNIDMTCVPLVKKGLNIMDLPLISKFVQSSINAALSEYVAPKSIPLDLQAMLAGDDFKKDTSARGVIVCHIRRAYEFKASDMSVPLIGNGKSSDAYVSVGWAKFGKPMWSSRIIMADMKPYWEETAYLLVGPEELDAEESLRVQLWDSDKFSADDDLGRIELVLKDVMRDKRSNGKMWNRTDSFKALESGKGMPGTLDWSVGYFSKVRLLESQMRQQVKDKDIESIDQLKQQVYERAEKKLRETAKNESSEVKQLKEDDWENEQINMITSSVPSADYPSGILSIHVHNIIGLSMENTRKNKSPEEEEQVDGADENNLPDSYCTLIVDDQKAFKTRTKPKNSEPFFNAATERFVRDWRNTVVMISVRDSRVHEDDPLLGHVYLNIGDLFRDQKASRINSFWPLAGGIGYGRLRVSLVFRSVHMQMPPRELGWNTGVLEVASEAISVGNLSKHVAGHRIKVRTNTSKGRMHSAKAQDDDTSARWRTIKEKPLLLAVRKRYASNVIFEFKSSSSGLLPKSKKATAFCIGWLKDIADEEWTNMRLEIYENRDNLLERATANVLPNEDIQDAKMDELDVRVKFWRGLGKAHRKLAKNNMDVANVLEVRDAARELGNGPPIVGANGWRKERDAGSASSEATDDDSDQSDDSSDDDDDSKSRGDQTQGNQKQVGDASEDEHVSKVGAMAQRARNKMSISKSSRSDEKERSDDEHVSKMDAMKKKMPLTKAHKDAKQESATNKSVASVASEETSAGRRESTTLGEYASQDTSTTQSGQKSVASNFSDPDRRENSTLDNVNSQQAPSAPHASIGPSHGRDALRDELQSSSSQSQPEKPAAGSAGTTHADSGASDNQQRGLSTQQTQDSQEASSAVQVTTEPSQGTDAVKDKLHSAEKDGKEAETTVPESKSAPEQPSTATAVASKADDGAPLTTPIAESQSPPADTNAPEGTYTSRVASKQASQTSQENSRPSTSSQTHAPGVYNSDTPKDQRSQIGRSPSPQRGPSRTPSAPGTPLYSRPTTATTSTSKAPAESTPAASQAPSTPKTSMSQARDSPSPSNSDKRRSGVFHSLKRSFSLKKSPLRSSEGKEKRSSMIASSENASPSKSPSRSNRPQSAYSPSPLASHPTNSSTEGKTSSPPGSSSGGRPEQDADGDHVDGENANREQLHRRHRGIMQFKGPRTANWIKHKADGVVGSAEKIAKPDEREKAAGVETEV